MMEKPDHDRLEECAASLGATLIFDVEAGATSWANVATKEVHLLPDVPGLEGGSFIVAMHELGHVATTEVDDMVPVNFLYELFGFHTDPPIQFEIEAVAWNWAVEHAGRPLTTYDREMISFSLWSYMAHAFNAFGMYPIHNPLQPGAEKIAKTVGRVDLSESSLLDWDPEIRDYLSEFDLAWNEALVGLTEGVLA